MYLLIFEFLGTNEVLVILVVALILLGPRRLPQMSRKLGKSLAEFKRASEEFKHTWEREVDLESTKQDLEPEHAMLLPQNSIPEETIGRGSVGNGVSETNRSEDVTVGESVPAPSVTSVDPSVMSPVQAPVSDEPAMTAPTRKRDWL